MNTYKDPEYRGYYLGKVVAALIVLLIIVITVAATREQGVTTSPVAAAATPSVAAATPAAAAAAPTVESAELSPDGVVTLSGTGEPGSTVELYAGDVRLGSISVGADGTWSYQGALEPGEYQFVARTVDETGQTVNESAVLAVSLGEATTSPAAEASGTSAIATGAPEAAQAAATGAAPSAGTAAAPMVESPLPLAAATAASGAVQAPATGAPATAAPAAGAAAALSTAAPGTAQAPAAGELATTAPGAAQAPGELATAAPGQLTTAPGAAQAPTAGELATAAPGAAQVPSKLTTAAPGAAVAPAAGQIATPAPPTTVGSAGAAAGIAAASHGLGVDRAMVNETGQVTLIGTGRPNAPIEMVQDGQVIATTVVKGDGTWTYTYTAIPGVQVMAVQYEGQPDSRSAPVSFQIEGTSPVAGAPTPSEAAAPASKPAASATSVKPQETGTGRAYIVREGDYLSKLARRFYGEGAQWQTIYKGTNKKAAADDSFAEIEDPDLIIPGWKLWIPAQ